MSWSIYCLLSVYNETQFANYGGSSHNGLLNEYNFSLKYSRMITQELCICAWSRLRFTVVDFKNWLYPLWFQIGDNLGRILNWYIYLYSYSYSKHVYIYISFIQIDIDVRTHTHSYIHTYMDLNTHIHTHIHIHIHAHIHIDTHIHIHTHIYILILM